MQMPCTLYQPSLSATLAVMPRLEPGIQTPVCGVWMAGSSPSMTLGAPMDSSLRELV